MLSLRLQRVTQLRASSLLLMQSRTVTTSQNQTRTTEEFKNRILESSLQFVNDYGWTNKTLQAGAEALGMPPVSASVFPRGPSHLFEYLSGKLNDAMAECLSTDEEIHSLPPKEILYKGLWYRLRLIEPYLSRWPEGMAVASQPQNFQSAVEHLALLVDEAWYHAGDEAAGLEFYGKRIALASAYMSCEIVMTQDKSQDYEDTRQFLIKRLDDVEDLTNLSSKGPLAFAKSQLEILKDQKLLQEKVGDKFQTVGQLFKALVGGANQVWSERQTLKSRKSESQPNSSSSDSSDIPSSPSSKDQY